MATKSYSKHKEYKEFSSSQGTVPYTDEQFDMIKTELLPKGSKLDSLGRNGGVREYHYEYKEEKLPSGKYDRKDLRTVEEYTIPPKTVPKASESNSYYYERQERELPLNGTRTYNYESTTSAPVYSKVKSGKVTKEMTQNVEELDSLLDDLQKDQERQLYKKSRVVPSQVSPAIPQVVPPTITLCSHCHQTPNTGTRFPTQPDGIVQRKIEKRETSESQTRDAGAKSPPIGGSKNVAGPAVYYPPGHTPFANKDSGYQMSL
ncbi:unnamed protein product [Leptidea sinapis]|uniref:Uncharacterized protein n=1 Tax=Leptidea sinapis TaxID=189913 RepID=A0A5E4R543_9NEOP|nr:unnamed protein product [Leptidea sinapis]